MALWLQPSDEKRAETVSFSDLLERLPDLGGLEKRERLSAISNLLHACSGEIDYVVGRLKRIVEIGAEGSFRDGFRDTSFILDRPAGYAVRVNRWKPNFSRRGENSYEVPHNHDFDLITKGIFGPGYKTDVYRFDSSSAKGEVGEKVGLKSLGVWQLSTGSVIWFEQFDDVHVQHPPEHFSLSLNIIPTGEDIDRGQFYFDVENLTISDFAENRQFRVYSVLKLLKELDRSHGADELILDVSRSTKSKWLARHAEELAYS